MERRTEGDADNELTTGANEASRRFQVLVLDGGGYRGMFSAALLAGLEEVTGKRLVDHFDLIVGTSTGGIIALGLAAGRTPSEILDFYAADGPAIFNHERRRRMRHLVAPKYDARKLAGPLSKVLGGKVLGEAAVPLCIPSYDLQTNQLYLIRTPHHPSLRSDWRMPMLDVAMATSAAPTYFKSHAWQGHRFIDGGVWANSPTLVGLIEARRIFGAALENIRVLNIGTMINSPNRPRSLDRGGAFAWSTHIADLMMRAQGEQSKNTLELLLRRDRALRIDPSVPDELRRIDNIDPKAYLAHGRDQTRRHSDTVLKTFLDHTAREYVPCYGPNASTLDAHTGSDGVDTSGERR